MRSVARSRRWRSEGGSGLSHTTVTSAEPEDSGAVVWTVQREPQGSHPLGPAGVWASVLATWSKRDGSSRSHRRISLTDYKTGMYRDGLHGRVISRVCVSSYTSQHCRVGVFEYHGSLSPSRTHLTHAVLTKSSRGT